MYHFKSKKSDIKSRAPFSKRFWNSAHIASQELPLLNVFWNTQTGDPSDTKGSNGQDRMSRKEAIFDNLSMKEAIVDDIPVDNEENYEGGVR